MRKRRKNPVIRAKERIKDRLAKQRKAPKKKERAPQFPSHPEWKLTHPDCPFKQYLEEKEAWRKNRKMQRWSEREWAKAMNLPYPDK